MQSPVLSFRPSILALESRDVPSTLLAESFEAVSTPAMPADWSQWHNSQNGGFITSHLQASTGSTSLASLGSRETQSRLWVSSPVAGDIAVSLSVRTDGPAPIQVLARGQKLNSTTPSFVSAEVGPGARSIRLIETTNGTSTVLGEVKSSGVFGPWVTIRLVTQGDTAKVSVQRTDSSDYLNAEGGWQTDETTLLEAKIQAQDRQGFVGLVRGTGGQGMTFLDDFTLEEVTPPTVRENFDQTPLAQLPTDWEEWSNDGTAGFGVTTSRALSPANGISATGSSVTSARVWHVTTQPANVQATASLFADSLIPTSVFVRGSNLETAQPSYYALTATRGVEVKIERVVDGVSTSLATLRSKQYVSQQWLRLTLTAEGDQLRAIVFRTDTQRWLSPEGDWLDFPQPALTVTDGAIRSAGLAGLSRSRLAAGAVTFDDVEFKALVGNTTPTVGITAPEMGTGYEGDVKIQASGSASVRRVEFRVNDLLLAVSPSLPSEFELDTTTLPNGPHTILIRAIDDLGNVGTATQSIVVNNPASTALPARPDLANHYDHIRIAQLAYSGTPMDDFAKARLADSVDLLIPNPAYLSTVNQVAPDTPQLIYTNLSNIYGDLLTSWLNTADAKGVSRELAFYHVSQATPHSHASPSSQPVTWFWSAYRGPAGTPTENQTNVLGETRGGRLRGTVFGSAGEAVTLGYVEKFREVNFDLARGKGAGWQSVIEYPTAVAEDGTPTAWKAMPLLADTTSGLAQSGQVLFDPPSDWVASAYGGNSTRLYTVRVRTVTGGIEAAPEAKTILGRDYVQAHGTDNGIIPAFDRTADTDGDGYLNDAEYAKRTTGKDARFVYESRLFYPYYGQMRFATNPSSSAVRSWLADYHANLLDASPLADGFFLDNSNGRLPIAGLPVLESTSSYSVTFANLVTNVWRTISPKIVVSNTAGGRDDATPIAAASTGVMEEYLLRATDANWASVEDVANIVTSRLNAAAPSPYVILDTHPGTFATNDPRLQSATLAYYYLVGDPDRTMLMFFGGYGPAASWSKTWIPAVSTDIGRPTGSMNTFATGADPENAALTYKVYARDYGNAKVLYKPLSYAAGKGTGTLHDATATTHDLGGNYRVLNADGTLGPVVNRITLRNGEGAVLMKA